MTKQRIRWGILGAGQIATVFCNALRFSSTGSLAAIASLDLRRSKQLAELFNCPKYYANYDDLVKDRDIDAVYIANLNVDHAGCAILAASHGKHILVEKPIATQLRDIETMFDAANASKVLLLEGFMYRYHPQLVKVKELIQSGKLGQITTLSSSFGYNGPKDPTHRVYQKDQGGGAILDVGCYTMSMARYLAQIILDDTALVPMEIRAFGESKNGVDVHSTAIVKFSEELSAHLTTSLLIDLPNQTTILGTEGTLTIPQPWLPSSPCRFAKKPLVTISSFPQAHLHLSYSKDMEQVHEIYSISVDKDLFSYEIDYFTQAILQGLNNDLSYQESFNNFQALEIWKQQIKDID